MAGLLIDPAQRSVEAREIRIELQRIAGELEDIALRVAWLGASTPFDEGGRVVKSPFTHRSSRSLWREVSHATYLLTRVRKSLNQAEQGLRHLDFEKPRLPYLKRLTRRTDPVGRVPRF